MFCQFCGAEISETSNFCEKCGRSINRTAALDRSEGPFMAGVIFFIQAVFWLGIVIYNALQVSIYRNLQFDVGSAIGNTVGSIFLIYIGIIILQRKHAGLVLGGVIGALDGLYNLYQAVVIPLPVLYVIALLCAIQVCILVAYRSSFFPAVQKQKK